MTFAGDSKDDGTCDRCGKDGIKVVTTASYCLVCDPVFLCIHCTAVHKDEIEDDARYNRSMLDNGNGHR